MKIRLIDKGRIDLHHILHAHIMRVDEYTDALRKAGKANTEEYKGAHRAALTGHTAWKCIVLEPRNLVQEQVDISNEIMGELLVEEAYVESVTWK